MARFQRARKPEEKEVRRKAILRAARDLAREAGPIDLSLNEVGRRSGVSKPNIYRYFESREHILLQLLVAELEDLADSIDAGLAAIEPASADAAIDAVAALVTREFLARPLLCQLLGMAASILEHNLSVEAIASSKLEMLGHAQRITVAFQRALPWLDVLDAAWAGSTIAMYVAGMWPSAHPSSTAVEALCRGELAWLRIDAPRDLARTITMVLRGMKASAKPRGR
jgi:AcrR family transcriptional regulator